jgi:hypothetical protein
VIASFLGVSFSSGLRRGLACCRHCPVERRSGTAAEPAHRDAVAAQREIEHLERVVQATCTGDEPNLQRTDGDVADAAPAVEPSKDRNRVLAAGPRSGGGIRHRRHRWRRCRSCAG